MAGLPDTNSGKRVIYRQHAQIHLNPDCNLQHFFWDYISQATEVVENVLTNKISKNQKKFDNRSQYVEPGL